MIFLKIVQEIFRQYYLIQIESAKADKIKKKKEKQQGAYMAELGTKIEKTDGEAEQINKLFDKLLEERKNRIDASKTAFMEKYRARIEEAVTIGVSYNKIALGLTALGHKINKSTLARYCVLAEIKPPAVVKPVKPAPKKAKPKKKANTVAEAPLPAADELLFGGTK